MSLSMKSKKIVASVMALSLVSSGLVASESSVISKFVSSNPISASAAVVYGDWEYEVTGDYTAKLVKYNGNDEYISIPQGIDGHSITELGEHLFQNNTTIKSVIIPRGIQSIPAFCFCNDTKLESVVMPLGIRTIERSAFARTKNLKSIALPISVEKIETFAFNDAGINSINMKNVKAIDKYAFKDCKDLRNVILPADLTAIPDSIFENCSALESITIPEMVTTIEKNAFRNCTSLESVDFSESLTTINSEAFRNCSSLKEVVLPESISVIGASSFRDCTSLTSLTIPAFTSKMFAPNCFVNCSSLENINSEDYEVLDSLFSDHFLHGCKNLRKINGEPLVVSVENSEPSFNPNYSSIIKNNYGMIDHNELGFLSDYLKDEIKYVVATNVTDDMSDVEKIKSLHDWLCNKVVYAYTFRDGIRVPDDSCNAKEDSAAFIGDSAICEGYARALALLLNEADIEAYYTGSYGNGTDMGHAWCIVKLGDHYFHVDATHDDSGADPNGTIDYDHFLISDTDIKKCSNGHSAWVIEAPSSRFTYTLPAETPKCSYSVGDVNMDGVINRDDANLIWDYYKGNIDSIDTVLADVNFDGKIDWQDYLEDLERPLP